MNIREIAARDLPLEKNVFLDVFEETRISKLQRGN
jgi:hypothetical protein